MRLKFIEYIINAACCECRYHARPAPGTLHALRMIYVDSAPKVHAEKFYGGWLAVPECVGSREDRAAQPASRIYSFAGMRFPIQARSNVSKPLLNGSSLFPSFRTTGKCDLRDRVAAFLSKKVAEHN